MDNYIIDLRDTSLFGNSASEDETDDIFESYAVRRDEVDRFISEDKICIINTLKGCGKSAIMRIAENELKRKQKILINLTLIDITQNYEDDDPDKWVIKWKQSIYTKIAEEIGALYNIPIDEFKSSIKQIAIDAGTRKANFFDVLLKKISSIKIESHGITAELPRTELPYPAGKIGNIFKQNLNNSIYFFVDDTDHNFINTKYTKAKLVGFLTACRYISNETQNIKFRLSLRPNSWNIIRKEYPSMNSHINQYILKMHWTHGDIKKLLEKRISGYIKRNYQVKENNANMLSLIFDDVMWDNNKTQASQPIATYSKGRPRWAKEIFRLAAESAANNGRKKIQLVDINNASANLGDDIINEITAEFACEYPDIEKYIRSFQEQKKSFKEDELFILIKNMICNHVSNSLTAREIAYALFYCGFLYARENLQNGRYKNYYFNDKPHLFTEGNSESGKYSWEIDLIFRNVLNIKDIIHSNKTKRNNV